MAPLTAVRVRGALRPPGDKSISHRALILAAVTRGKSHIRHILDSADVQSTARALRALGADIPVLAPETVVTGKQSRFLTSPRDPIDCGNSGTTTRLLAGVVAGAGLSAIFRGDASLSRRPMRRIADPLGVMGARVTLAPHGGLPMSVSAGPLRPIEWDSSVASAQVKSAILLAALLGGVGACVREPHLSRDHTERMLAARGVEIEREGQAVTIPPGQVMRPVDIDVPADPSSAAFFVALAILADHGELRLQHVCLNESRTGFFHALRRMGADVAIEDMRDEGGEPTGTLVARPSRLRGISIAASEVPSMIDELPLLACIASRAEGDTVVHGAAELRVKESDRISAVVSNLQALRVDAEELEDGFRVRGSLTAVRGTVETRGDHRIAMSFGVLGAVSGNEVAVDDGACVDVSYPGFWDEMTRVTS